MRSKKIKGFRDFFPSKSKIQKFAETKPFLIYSNWSPWLDESKVIMDSDHLSFFVECGYNGISKPVGIDVPISSYFKNLSKYDENLLLHKLDSILQIVNDGGCSFDIDVEADRPFNGRNKYRIVIQLNINYYCLVDIVEYLSNS